MKVLPIAAAVILAGSIGPAAAQDFFTPDFDPVVALGGQAPLIYPMAPVELLVTEAQSNGQFGMVVLYTKTGDGPPRNALTEYKLTETFYVLEGQHRFFVGDKEYDGGPGTVIVNPPKVPHGFTCISDGICRLLVLTTPSEADPGKGTGFFTQLAAMAKRSPEWIARTNAAYGIDRPPPQ
jgi:quercetin dioxygenase-like cupin family protein